MEQPPNVVHFSDKWQLLQKLDRRSEVLNLILRRNWRTKTPPITHIILSGQYGGTLSIPDDDHKLFMDAYCKDISCGMAHYLREQRTDVFPLSVDLDYKPKTIDLAWTSDQLHLWVQVFQTVLKKCYTEEQTTYETPTLDPFLCIVAKRPADFNYVQDETNHEWLHPKSYKQGFRLAFPNLHVTSQTALLIRRCVLRELISNGQHCRTLCRNLAETDLINEVVYEELDNMLDESVYLSNGFRMIGSSKIVPSLCSRNKKQTPCNVCFDNDKFDIGLVYSLFGVFPSTEFSDPLAYKKVRQQLFQHFSDIDQLIRACSVRLLPPKPERPNFTSCYDISKKDVLIAHKTGSICLSNDEKKLVRGCDRMIELTDPKFDALVRYFRTGGFPRSWPFAQFTRKDIKSIGFSSQYNLFKITLHSFFCVVKKDHHSSAQSGFVLHADPKKGLRPICWSDICKKAINRKDYAPLPPVPSDMYQLFFPPDKLSQFCGIPQKHPPPTKENETKEDEKSALTTNEIMENVSSYYSSTSMDLTFEDSTRIMCEIDTLFRNRMQIYETYCRDSSNNRYEELTDTRTLIEQQKNTQGIATRMFRPSGSTGRGRRGGRTSNSPPPSRASPSLRASSPLRASASKRKRNCVTTFEDDFD